MQLSVISASRGAQQTMRETGIVDCNVTSGALPTRILIAHYRWSVVVGQGGC